MTARARERGRDQATFRRCRALGVSSGGWAIRAAQLYGACWRGRAREGGTAGAGDHEVLRQMGRHDTTLLVDMAGPGLPAW